MGESRIKYVRKRDGRLVPFDKQKIADAIFKAAQSVGGQDRYLAEDLAEVVKIYLEREYKGDIPSVEEIQDIVERVLIKTGHAKTAKAYILYREKRARARQIREGVRPESLAEREILERDLDLSVRRSDGRIGIWDRSFIVDVLVRETGISRNIAELIVAEVEEDVIASKAKGLTSSAIREMVNAKLILYGFEEERLRHSRIGLPFYDISAIFQSFEGSPDTLSLYLGRRMKREFAMNSVIPYPLVEKYLKGEIDIVNIEGIDKILDIYMPVRTKGEIHEFYERLSPVVEGSIVFSVKDRSLLSEEQTGIDVIVKEEPYPAVDKNRIPLIAIEDYRDIQNILYTALKQGRTISLHKKMESPLLVLNRVILNIPVMISFSEQNGINQEDYLSRIIALFRKLLSSQHHLFKSMPYTKKYLDSVEGYIPLLEVGVEYNMGKELLNDRFISEIVDNHFILSIFSPEESLMEQIERCSGKEITVRIRNG